MPIYAMGLFREYRVAIDSQSVRRREQSTITIVSWGVRGRPVREWNGLA